MPPTTLEAERALLDAHLDAVEAGTESIAAFNSWFFMESRLEAFDDGVELAWGVESILYQWGDFRDVVGADEVVASIRQELAAHGYALSPS